MSKLLHDIRRAELVRREVERARQMGGRDSREEHPGGDTPPEPNDERASYQPDNAPQGFPPESPRSTADAERRMLAAARARKAAEGTSAAQATARAEADRNAARLALQRAEMEKQAEQRAQARIAAN
ncbi:MAG: hypothetical protein ACXWUB_02260, partial [Burkholderiales bacterium]